MMDGRASHNTITTHTHDLLITREETKTQGMCEEGKTVASRHEATDRFARNRMAGSQRGVYFLTEPPPVVPRPMTDLKVS